MRALRVLMHCRSSFVTAAGRPAPAETPLDDVFALFQELTTARGGRGGACCLELLSCGADPT